MTWWHGGATLCLLMRFNLYQMDYSYSGKWLILFLLSRMGSHLPSLSISWALYSCKRPTMIHVIIKKTARLFHVHLYKLHGLPKLILSNMDARFTCSFFNELHGLLVTNVGYIHFSLSSNWWTNRTDILHYWWHIAMWCKSSARWLE